MATPASKSVFWSCSVLIAVILVVLETRDLDEAQRSTFLYTRLVTVFACTLYSRRIDKVKRTDIDIRWRRSVAEGHQELYALTQLILVLSFSVFPAVAVDNYSDEEDPLYRLLM